MKRRVFVILNFFDCWPFYTNLSQLEDGKALAFLILVYSICKICPAFIFSDIQIAF